MFIRGHSITTWTERGGEGGNQMSTIVHVREGGGLKDVHMDKSYEKCTSGAVRYVFEYPFFEHERFCASTFPGLNIICLPSL